jgi:hypothetical protein
VCDHRCKIHTSTNETFPPIGSSLAAECGITPAQFTNFNPSSSLCSSLTPGERVCCSAGTLPDYAPKPYSNGTCYTYYVQPGDYCAELAATYSITVDQIGTFNKNTWGWMGCNDLQAGETMCLSTGAAPMPSYIQNSVCGPQVVGTPIVAAGTNLSLLNQCPLNACCDIWGQVRAHSTCLLAPQSTGLSGRPEARCTVFLICANANFCSVARRRISALSHSHPPARQAQRLREPMVVSRTAAPRSSLDRSLLRHTRSATSRASTSDVLA